MVDLVEGCVRMNSHAAGCVYCIEGSSSDIGKTCIFNKYEKMRVGIQIDKPIEKVTETSMLHLCDAT
jgi:hypothetical protein